MSALARMVQLQQGSPQTWVARTADEFAELLHELEERPEIVIEALREAHMTNWLVRLTAVPKAE